MDIPGFPQKYYANHTALSVMKTASYVSVSLVADTLLVNQSVCNSPHQLEAHANFFRFIEPSLSGAAIFGLALSLLFYSYWLQVSSTHLQTSELKYPIWLCTAISVWFTLSHNQGLAGREVLTSTTVDHSKYFYAATLTLNIICTCKYVSNGEFYFLLMNFYFSSHHIQDMEHTT